MPHRIVKIKSVTRCKALRTVSGAKRVLFTWVLFTWVRQGSAIPGGTQAP